jgi:hypothetical protein
MYYFRFITAIVMKILLVLSFSGYPHGDNCGSNYFDVENGE